jgi:magnesium-dependent phosphatase 1
MSTKPLIVFDLDYTLWDCGGTWCDCLDPPFHERDGKIYDSYRRDPIRLYDDVPEIIDALLAEGHQLAIASRTGEPGWARELMGLLGIAGLFDFEEIYPGSKVTHFKKIAADSGRSFAEIVFFDDEHRNIEEVGALGVRAVIVHQGVDSNLVERALEESFN